MDDKDERWIPDEGHRISTQNLPPDRGRYVEPTKWLHFSR